MTQFVAHGIVGLVGDGPPGRRLGSRCVDVAVAALVTATFLGGGTVLLGEDTGDGTYKVGAAAAVSALVAGFVVAIAVVALLDLGRRVFGLRLADGDGNAAAFPKRMTREALAVAPLVGIAAASGIHPALTVALALGYFALLWLTLAQGRTRRVDRIVGTRVVERAR